ncbi:hypothetical protein VTK73DRAFT_6405 [Phialemonium thermophilum]|uniref:TATA-binding protein interacting (TIP20) domain-containing protein n=1 Tax=Phialemonium thermophilum TaxID=223376 RepID=A0ABR3WKD6_9PEZI
MEKPGSTQYLLLQSVKELLQQTALSATDMGPYADTIWNRLLEASKTEENTAVCAECIGRIVILEPEAYMPKLDSLLKNSSPGLRAIAVQALRYTLPEENEVFDRALRPYLVEMLKAMLDDPEMEIRRHAMSTLNSAAHNKPDLILEHLGQLMPFVLRESVIKRELIREIQMGPFKHVVDDGLEVRKAAYETLYALMETAFSRINIVDLYDRIVEGLRDDNDIRGLCNLMVSKLVFIEPDETARRLDAIAEAFRATLSAKLKETAVKQELEKQDEAKKSVLRVTLLLGDKLKPAALASGSSSLSSSSSSSGGAIAGAHPAWTSYWEWVNKEFAPLLSSLRAESREMAGTAA